MRRIRTFIISLLIALTLLFHVHKPSDSELTDESPTTQTSAVTPFDDALQAPKPTIIAEDMPQDNAESTQVKPETIEVSSAFYVSD